jgi:hypothetical protein
MGLCVSPSLDIQTTSSPRRMGDPILENTRLASWCLAALVTARTGAQSLPQGGSAASNARAVPAPAWRQSTVRFSDGKPVLGLPPRGSRSVTHCSNDGTTFVDLYADSSLPGSQTPELFSVSPSGEVRYLRRKVPSDFTGISVRGLRGDVCRSHHAYSHLSRRNRQPGSPGGGYR